MAAAPVSDSSSWTIRSSSSGGGGGKRHKQNLDHDDDDDNNHHQHHDDFLRTKFRQQAYHIPAAATTTTTKSPPFRGGGRGGHTASENIFVWLQQPQQQQNQPAVSKASSSPEEVEEAQEQSLHDKNNNTLSSSSSSSLIRSIEVGDSETALALYRAGHPMYCRAPTELEQLLVPALFENTGLGCGQYFYSSASRTGLPQDEDEEEEEEEEEEEQEKNGNHPSSSGRFLRRSAPPRSAPVPPCVTTATSCLGRGEIELFVSAQAGAVTEWHYDFQENFTLQLPGRKKWNLQSNTRIHSTLPRAVTPHYQSKSVVEGQLLAARLVASSSLALESSSSVTSHQNMLFQLDHHQQHHELC